MKDEKDRKEFYKLLAVGLNANGGVAPSYTI